MTLAEDSFEMYPASMLREMHEDQRRVLKAWGVTLPDDSEIFNEDTPLSVKVRLFDFMIREAMEAEFV